MLINIQRNKMLLSGFKRLKNNAQALPIVYKRNYTSASDLSYVTGPQHLSLLGLTVGGAVDRAADEFGDREAIVSCHQNIRKTFTEVKKETDKLAAGLLALGLKRGDRVGIWGPNSYEWYLTKMAVGKAGLVLVNINPSYISSELKYCLNKVSISAIICAEKFKVSNYYELLCDVAPELPASVAGDLKSKEAPSLKTVIMISQKAPSGTFSFDSVMSGAGSEHVTQMDVLASKIQFDDIYNIQFTSGTTGVPKAALLSHHNIVNNAYFTGVRLDYDKKPLRLCLPVPLFHCLGSVAGVMAAMLHGCTSVMSGEAFNAREALDCFEKEKINFCYGTPTMYVDILKEQRKSAVDVSTLCGGVMGGAPCPQELVNGLINDLNMKEMIILYGMTETSPCSFICYRHDSLVTRTTTIGCPADHTEVKIIDTNGQIVPRGSPGEVCVRGYCNFLGYWGDQAKTDEIIGADRWLKTGDLGVLDADGYGRIIGRLKDVIIRGGENIYPAEIESFYMTHPEIIEAQVFGIPDDRLGEEAVMWLRLTPDSALSVDEVKRWSKAKIAYYKIPRRIFVKDDFPKTTSGKAIKWKMREMTIETMQQSDRSDEEKKKLLHN